MNSRKVPCAIGIDVGSSRFVISAIKNGGVDVLTNNANYRQTPNVVSYGKLRTAGETALANAKQGLKNTIFASERFLGDLEELDVKEEQKVNFVKIQKEKSSLVFSLTHEGQNVLVKPEQSMAAIFTEIQNTLSLNQVEGTEFVVSVPDHFSVQERQALLQSAEIAGIRINKLSNESSGVLMNYGIFRKADLHAEQSRIVGFVDVGYSKTSFFVAAVKKNGAEILYEKIDRNLGV